MAKKSVRVTLPALEEELFKARFRTAAQLQQMKPIASK